MFVTNFTIRYLVPREALERPPVERHLPELLRLPQVCVCLLLVTPVEVGVDEDDGQVEVQVELGLEDVLQ